jgi:hypothetical protein
VRGCTNLALQRRLNLEKVLHYRVNVNSLRMQIAVSDLIAKRVILHDLRPWASGPGFPIEDQSRPILESQPRQTVVVRIVYVPCSTDCPISTRLSMSNDSATHIINRSLQLPPTQNKVGLIVDPLLRLDSVYGVRSSTCSRLRSLSFEFGVNLKINRSDMR